MQLMKVSSFLEEYFVPGNAPSVRTIRKAIDNNELPGTQIGSNYYVDVSKLNQSKNPLVNKVLNS